MQTRGHGIDCDKVLWVEGSCGGNCAKSNGTTAYNYNCALVNLRGVELREAVADGIELRKELIKVEGVGEGRVQ